MEDLAEIKDTQITKAVEVIRKRADDSDKQLLDDEDIMLQFALNKIPKASNNNSKIIKICLPHNVEMKDVCLFVGEGSDKTKRQRENINDTIAMYEDQLRKIGLSQITEVIPLLKLKLEYQTYESRRALVSRFDSFLADDSIMRFLPSLLGKVFYGNKKHPTPVKMRRGTLERELRKALQTKQCVLSSKGPSNSVTVAQLSLEDKEVVTNVRAAIDKIMKSVPGGADNIRSFHLFRRGCVALPIYLCSAEKAAQVDIPTDSQTEKKEEPLVEEVSTINGQVSVSKDGTITIFKDGKPVKITDMLAAKGKKRSAIQKNGDKGTGPANKVSKKGTDKKTKPAKKETDSKQTEKPEVEPVEEIEEEGSDESALEFSSDSGSEAGDLSAADDGDMSGDGSDGDQSGDKQETVPSPKQGKRKPKPQAGEKMTTGKVQPPIKKPGSAKKMVTPSKPVKAGKPVDGIKSPNKGKKAKRPRHRAAANKSK